MAVGTRRTQWHVRQDDGPALPLYLSEPGRAVADYGLYLAARPLLPRLPRGDGHPVLVLPGLLADDVSTRALRTVLRKLGYDVHGWGLGRNIGPTAACVNGIRDRSTELTDRYRQPVTVIGWSLGGIFARDLARRSPESVRQVVTLGSPFRLARNSQSRATKVFDRFSHLHVEHRTLPLESENSRCWCRRPRSTRTSTASCTGRPAWTPPASAARTSPSWPATWASGTTRLASGPWPTGWPSPRATWKPFKAPLFLRPAFPRPDEPLLGFPIAATNSAA